MIAIYDFEKTVEAHHEAYYAEIKGVRYAIDMERAQNYFGAVLARHNTFSAYETLIREDPEAFKEMEAAVTMISSMPPNPLDDVEYTEYAILYLKFLFNIFQRYTKRYICDTVLMGDEDHHH